MSCVDLPHESRHSWPDPAGQQPLGVAPQRQRPVYGMPQVALGVVPEYDASLGLLHRVAQPPTARTMGMVRTSWLSSGRDRTARTWRASGRSRLGVDHVRQEVAEHQLDYLARVSLRSCAGRLILRRSLSEDDELRVLPQKPSMGRP